MNRRPAGGWAGGLALAVLAFACSGAACGKKSSANPDDVGENPSFDDSEPAPEARQPVTGADLSRLGDAEKARFERLVDKLVSPCGKAHSLRTSRNTDAECKSAPFAVKYVVEMLVDGLTNEEATELYDMRFKQTDARRGFKVSAANPHSGPDDGRVVLIEFFDYGCPACQQFKPVLEEAAAGFPSDVVVYYKMFPLAAHEHSQSAAQAAIAAHAQGKFKEMHDVLFANPDKHTQLDVIRHAIALGLDEKKFEADFRAAEATVIADKREGEEAGIRGTPTLYINGRKYDGVEHAKYVKLWIEEELALK